MEVDKKNILIQIVSLWLFFFPLFSYSQNSLKEEKYDVKSQKDRVQIHFFIDNKETSLSKNILEKLQYINLSELDESIIDILIRTNLYQNVSVKQYITKNGINIFVVNAESIKKIQDIVVNGVSFTEKEDYLKLISTKPGQTYDEKITKEDAKKILKFLNDKGYLNAKVEILPLKEDSSDLLKLILNIKKDNPCRIDEVIIQDSFSNILNFLTVPVETGSLCDINSIHDALEKQKENYWEQGYLESKIKIKNILYSKSKESAKITLQIDRGAKTEFQIFEEDRNFLNKEFLISKKGLTFSDLVYMSDDDLITVITNFYQKKGFAFANVVGPERIIEKNGNKVLKFFLKKGPFVRIGKIFFIGISPTEQKSVIKEIGLRTNLFGENIPFIKENLNIYKEKIHNYIIDQGYESAQVAIPDFIPSNDNTEMNLIFHLEKGPRYILKKIAFTGIPDKFVPNNDILFSILKPEEPFNTKKKQRFIEEYQKQLLSQGYLYAEISSNQETMTKNKWTKNVDLSLTIRSGPLVHIGKIYVDTDLVKKEKSIISASGIHSGDVFDQKKLENARIQILRHDIFASVLIEPLDFKSVAEKQPTLDLIIHAKTRTGYSLGISPGWRQLSGYTFGTDFLLNKINNDGLRFFSTIAVSQEKHQQSFAANETKQILGREINLGFFESLFSVGSIMTPLDVSSVLGYQVAAETLTNREYLTLKLIADWKPSFFNLNWKLSTTLIHEASNSTSSDSAIVYTLDSPSIQIRELLGHLSLDTRNNIAWPTLGSLWNIQTGISRFGLGSAVQFNRYSGSLDTFFPLYKKLSGAVSIGGKFIKNTVNKDGSTVTPPASRRASLMDTALVRGFPESYGSSSPGPLLWMHYTNNNIHCNNQLVALGSTNLMYFKVEARYRMSDVFGFVTFLDSGLSYFTENEVNEIQAQIRNKINIIQNSATECVVDNASLVTSKSLKFLKDYFRNAYISTGIGMRVILGNYATLSLDYGYPLQDPDFNNSQCLTPQEALMTNTPPLCVSRIQKSGLLFIPDSWIKLKGAVHLRIGTQF